MKEKTRLSVQRDAMVKECASVNIKVDRSGMTVKQQIPVLTKALEPKRREEAAKVKAKQDLIKAQKEAMEKAKADAEAKAKLDAKALEDAVKNPTPIIPEVK